MRAWIRRGLLLIVLVAVVLALWYAVFRSKPVPVTVYRAARGRVDAVVTNSKAGTVKTRKRASLSPEIGGLVTELPVREGQAVARGDVLLRLSDADLRARVAVNERALEAAQSARHETCTNAEQAERDLTRYLQLERDRIVSEELLDQFQSRRDAAYAACEGARARTLEASAALDLSGVELAKTVLHAPFAGVVAEVSTELGEWITPSPPGVPLPPVIELLDPEAIYVSAPLDEVDLGRVRTGQPVRITLDAFAGRDFDGRVVRVAPYVLDVEEQNRTFEIEVAFDDPAAVQGALPGASADVEVILDVVQDVLRVPSYAVLEGRRVLVLRDGLLASVEVTTGLSNWQFTEIREGLAVGDPVVVSLDRLEVQPGARAVIEGESER